MVHVTHVGFNPQTGEFTGMPREWHVLLQQSGITKTEQRQNPQVNLGQRFFNNKKLTICTIGCFRCIRIL
jgi:p21-activated kinase 1